MSQQAPRARQNRSNNNPSGRQQGGQKGKDVIIVEKEKRHHREHKRRERGPHGRSFLEEDWAGRLLDPTEYHRQNAQYAWQVLRPKEAVESKADFVGVSAPSDFVATSTKVPHYQRWEVNPVGAEMAAAVPNFMRVVQTNGNIYNGPSTQGQADDVAQYQAWNEYINASATALPFYGYGGDPSGTPAQQVPADQYPVCWFANQGAVAQVPDFLDDDGASPIWNNWTSTGVSAKGATMRLVAHQVRVTPNGATLTQQGTLTLIETAEPQAGSLNGLTLNEAAGLQGVWRTELAISQMASKGNVCGYIDYVRVPLIPSERRLCKSDFSKDPPLDPGNPVWGAGALPPLATWLQGPIKSVAGKAACAFFATGLSGTQGFIVESWSIFEYVQNSTPFATSNNPMSEEFAMGLALNRPADMRDRKGHHAAVVRAHDMAGQGAEETASVYSKLASESHHADQARSFYDGVAKTARQAAPKVLKPIADHGLKMVADHAGSIAGEVMADIGEALLGFLFIQEPASKNVKKALGHAGRIAYRNMMRRLLGFDHLKLAHKPSEDTTTLPTKTIQ